MKEETNKEDNKDDILSEKLFDFSDDEESDNLELKTDEEDKKNKDDFFDFSPTVNSNNNEDDEDNETGETKEDKDEEDKDNEEIVTENTNNKDIENNNLPQESLSETILEPDFVNKNSINDDNLLNEEESLVLNKDAEKADKIEEINDLIKNNDNLHEETQESSEIQESDELFKGSDELIKKINDSETQEKTAVEINKDISEEFNDNILKVQETQNTSTKDIKVKIKAFQDKNIYSESENIRILKYFLKSYPVPVDIDISIDDVNKIVKNINSLYNFVIHCCNRTKNTNLKKKLFKDKAFLETINLNSLFEEYSNYVNLTYKSIYKARINNLLNNKIAGINSLISYYLMIVPKKKYARNWESLGGLPAASAQEIEEEEIEAGEEMEVSSVSVGGE